jgi:hypothetical protein
MHTLRRIGLLGLAGVVIAAFAAPAAHADTAEAFSATGTARALHISVLGQDATFGATDGTVGAPLTAVANAAGQLLQPASLSKVSLSSDNSTASDPTNGQQKCAVPSLPDPLGTILKTDLACSLAKADITKGAPHAIGTAGVASVTVQANTLLQSVLGNTPLGSLKLGDTVNQVTSQLQPVLDAINAQSPVKLDPTSTITDLLNALTTQQTLSLDLGKSTSDLTTAVGDLTSTSTALGGQVKILPIAALNNTPLATITIGSAKTTAVYDRVKGAGTASFDPSIVTVDLAPVLGLSAQTIKVAPGQTITLLQGTPLESTITLADGHTETSGKSAKAVADGVSIQLFKGLTSLLPTTGANSVRTAAADPSAAVVVELAHAESAVTGNPASTTPNPAAPPAPEVKALAFTGTSPWLPVGGVALLAGFWGTRRLRRRITA